MKRLQKSVSLVLIFALLFSFSSMAMYITEDGDFDFNIKGTNAYVMKYLGDNPDVVIPATMTHNGVEYPVTEIHWNAFSDTDAVTSVQFPDSMTRIPDELLLGFSTLVSVDIGGAKEIGASAFESCKALRDVQWNQVKTIGDEAFADCPSLTEVTLPDTVTRIGMGVFRDCSGIETLSIGSGVKDIPASAFDMCTSLETVYLGENTETVSEAAFKGCFEKGGDVYAYDKLTSFPVSILGEGFTGTVHCYPDSYMATLAAGLDWNVELYTFVDVKIQLDAPLTVTESKDLQAPPTEGVHVLETYTDANGAVPDRDVTADAVFPEELYFDTVGTAYVTVTYKQYSLSYEVTVEHDYQIVVIEPTCTTGGYTVYSCKVCNEKYMGDETEKLGHLQETIPGREATCTMAGLTDGIKCSRCNTVLVKQRTIPIKSHTPVPIPGSDSTCTVKGKTEGTKCDVCGKIIKAQTDKPLAAHTIVTIPGTPATCTEPGIKDGKKCEVCGTIITEQTEISAFGHDFSIWETLRPATCTEDGLAEKTCKYCGVKEEVTISATGHNLVTAVVGPTCTEQGYTNYKCNRCGVIDYNDNYTEALGHNFSASGWIVTVQPGCTTEGSRTGNCTRCHIKRVETIEALGHQESVVASTPATCTTPGLTAGKKCDRCNEIFSAQETIPALGHKYNGKVTKAPTCVEKGVNTYRCSVCGDTYTEEVNATGVHTFGAWVYADAENHEKVCSSCGVEKETGAHQYVEDPRQYVAPTFTQSGKRVFVCDVCGHSYEETIAPSDCTHNWDAGEITTAATCVKDGVRTFTCSICTETRTETVPASGVHSYTVPVSRTEATCIVDGVVVNKCATCEATKETALKAPGHTEETIAGKDATCTESGLTVGKRCSVCEEVLVKQETISALGHAFGEWITVVASCTEGGSKTRTCSRCEEEETQTISATGHSYDAVVTNPTCTEQGYTTYTCSVCGDNYRGDYTAVAGHDYKPVVTNPTCTEQGYTTYTCSACGDNYKSDYTEVTGHNYKSVVTNPTCTEQGYTTHTCASCGNSYKDSKTNALGHNYKSKVVAPTKQAAGYTLYTCDRCDANYKDNFTAPLPTVEIRNFVKERKLDYRRSLQFEAVVTNPVANAEVHWFVDGKDVNMGELHVVSEAKKSYTISAKYIKDGRVLDETETEKVTVNTGFFAKLKAFFQNLFKKLPVLVQAYVGIEKV